MKALIWNLVTVICLFAILGGGFLLLNRPLGVAVNCNGSIEGLGAPSFPLTSYKRECGVEVEVYSEERLVCSGSGDVRGQRSIVSCPGLEKADSRKLRVKAIFYNQSSNYANTSTKFRMKKD